MAELFEEVVSLLESRSSTRALAGQFRVESEAAAGNGAVLGVPVFLSAIQRMVADPVGSVSLLKVLRSVDTTALQEPGRTIESRLYEPIGTDLTEMLLGEHRPDVALVISGEAGISERSANALLPPTAWAVTASIADRYGSRIDRQSLLSILGREEADLVANGWGPWLQATAPEQAPAPEPTPKPTLAQLPAPAPVPASSRRRQSAGGAVPAPSPTQIPAVAEESQHVNQAYPLPRSRTDRVLRERESIPHPVPDHPGRVAHGGAGADVGGRGRLDAAPVEAEADRFASAALGAEPSRFDAGVGGGVASTAARTGQVDPFSADLDRIRDDDDDERSILPVMFTVLFLLAGLIGAVWFFAVRDSGDAQAVGSDTTDTAVEAEDGVEAVAPPNVATEPLAINLVLIDPSGQSEAAGVAELRFDPGRGEICYNLTTEGVGAPFTAQILVGTPGVQGPVLVNLGVLDNEDIGCVSSSATEMSAILDDLGGHYIEVVDPSQAFAIRAQLSEAMADGENRMEALAGLIDFDEAAGGANAIVEPGRLTLLGDVADQDTFDWLASEYNDVAAQGLEVVNQMELVPGSPLPSGRLVLPGTDLFAVGGTALSDQGQATVDTLAQILLARPQWAVEIVGHTDATGDDELNLSLSSDRAEAVRVALVEAGVPDALLSTGGAGSSEPVADNETAEGRAQNRRIELTIDRG